MIITRFAPSPTGFLHIGGARTALFNWLFARHHQGRFLLRIEDTDRARSTDAAIAAILDGMSWLGLNWDGDAIYQFARAERHREIALEMVKRGAAYFCYTPQEEINEQRNHAMAAGKSFRFESPWRDHQGATPDTPPVVRLKAPRHGVTLVEDQVMGSIRFPNEDLDDMVLLRGDGTPTYMLAVVVDDHDMGITHIIRGDDHLTNAGRQTLIYQAMDWDVPHFAHLPLIHGPDGAKLSKRHGALGVDAYRDMGYLPETLRNYLLRLGWSHGDDEIISTDQAIQWFNLDHVGKSPSRMDFQKLENLNHHYLQQAATKQLCHLLQPMIEQKLNHSLEKPSLEWLERGLTCLKPRAKTLLQLADAAAMLVNPHPIPLDEKSRETLTSTPAPYWAELLKQLQVIDAWEKQKISDAIQATVAALGIAFKQIGMPLRVALTGSTNAPANDDIMEALGKTESLRRIEHNAMLYPPAP